MIIDIMETDINVRMQFSTKNQNITCLEDPLSRIDDQYVYTSSQVHLDCTGNRTELNSYFAGRFAILH